MKISNYFEAYIVYKRVFMEIMCRLECGSENIMPLEEPEMEKVSDFDEWEWTWIKVKETLNDSVVDTYSDKVSLCEGLKMIQDNPIQWHVKGKRTLQKEFKV